MACDNCYNSSCTSTCGCPQQVKGTCVFYQGTNLDCLDVTKGDDYDSILANLNTLICNLNPPSGIATVVTGCSSITVTNPSDNVYNVCLSTATQTQINNNTTTVAALSACLTNTVADITVDSSITKNITSGPCGRTIDLSVNFPTPDDPIDGIVESNNDKSTYTNTPGIKVLKASTFTDFENNSLLANGDEIRFRLTGQITGDGSNADTVIIRLYDGSITVDKEVKGFDLTNRQSWIAEGVITVTDIVNGDGIYTLTFFSNSLANGGFGIPNSNSKISVSEDIAGIDYSNLVIKTVYDHKSTTTDTSNFARQLMIEVRKKI